MQIAYSFLHIAFHRPIDKDKACSTGGNTEEEDILDNGLGMDNDF